MKKLQHWIVAGVLLLVCWGCSPGSQSIGPESPPVASLQLATGSGSQLIPFGSQEEFSGYVNGVAPKSSSSSFNSSAPVASPDEVSSSSASNNQEITNNQEKGVDEGGIVKNYKDILVVLHRGRLTTAKISKNKTLSLISKMEMPAKGLGSSAWYDELLINDNLAIVVGYRWHQFDSYYNKGLIELNFFRVSDAGELTRVGTKLIESADYYSWRNYTSRLVDGQLVIYSPLMAWAYNKEGKPEVHIPQVYRLNEDGSLVVEGDLLSGTDVYKPFQDISWPVLHSVIRCDVGKPEDVSCTAKAILSDSSREFYVSPKTAYLWVNDDKNNAGLVYAMPLDGSVGGAFKLPVMPLDQFSFSETEKGLSLFGFSPDTKTVCSTEKSMVLAEIPMDVFHAESAREIQNYYTCLPSAHDSKGYGGLNVNRFNETRLVYGEGKRLLVIDRATKKIDSLNLPYNLIRLEKAGDRMMALSSSGYWTSAQLGLSSIIFSETPKISETVSLQDVYLNDWRSHSYSYKEEKDSGTFGVATLQAKKNSYYASIHFFDLKQNGTVVVADTMDEKQFTQPTTACTTSCIDWYGDSRPIFLNDQVLGLLGDQLTLGMRRNNGKLDILSHLNMNSGEVIKGN